MKKQKKAFTLVELLVVTTILILISIWSVFYFNDFVSNLELRTGVSKVENYIKDYDNRIKNRKLVDYEIYFHKNSFLYYDYENIFDTEKNQKINTIDFGSWNWIIKTNSSDWSVWELNIFEKDNFIIKKYLKDNKNFNYNFDSYLNYKIISRLAWKDINNININYFSKENKISLVEINSKNDKSGTSYTDLKIKNIWWRKGFCKLDNTKISWDKIYLFFEGSNWKQKILEIKK